MGVKPLTVAFVGIGTLARELLSVGPVWRPDLWRVVAAFDVDPKKVGRRLLDVVPTLDEESDAGGVMITAAPVLDSLTSPGAGRIDCPKGASQEWVRAAIRADGPDVVLFMAPPAEMVAGFWWMAAIHAGASIVNTTAARMAREPEIVARCHAAGVDCVGDEIGTAPPGPAARLAMVLESFCFGARPPVAGPVWWRQSQSSQFCRPPSPPGNGLPNGWADRFLKGSSVIEKVSPGDTSDAG